MNETIIDKAFVRIIKSQIKTVIVLMTGCKSSVQHHSKIKRFYFKIQNVQEKYQRLQNHKPEIVVVIGGKANFDYL